MISKKNIVTTINSVELEYGKAWDMLARMKSGDVTPQNAAFIFDFQPLLCSALLSLENMYRALSEERTAFIERKTRLNYNWFRQRLAKLDHYQTAIKGAIAMGKSLGDAFAWLFYQKNTELLEKHRQSERMLHLPTGVGAQGELEFIRNIKKIDNNLVIYHGTTTILRIGDLSLVDLTTMKVIGIAELKSHKVDDKIEIQGSIVVRRPHRLDSFLKLPSPQSIPSNPKPLPPRMAERLNRQISRIEESLKPSKEPDANLGIKLSVGSHLNQLRETLVRVAKGHGYATVIGEGLALVGLNLEYKSLGHCLLAFSPQKLAKDIKGLETTITKIVDKEAGSENAAFVGSFQAMDYERVGLLPGLTPLFWWPIDLILLKKLFFHNVAIITIFNPCHLKRKLREAGFTVCDGSNRGSFAVHFTLQGREAQFTGIEYYVNLMTDYLFDEQMIVDFMLKQKEALQSHNLPADRKCIINFQLTQNFGTRTQQ